jgi:hypothetical protein
MAGKIRNKIFTISEKQTPFDTENFYICSFTEFLPFCLRLFYFSNFKDFNTLPQA